MSSVSPVGDERQQRPQIHFPLPQSGVRATSLANPFETDSAPARGLAHEFDRQARGCSIRTGRLEWRVRIPPDPVDTILGSPGDHGLPDRNTRSRGDCDSDPQNGFSGKPRHLTASPLDLIMGGARPIATKHDHPRFRASGWRRYPENVKSPAARLIGDTPEARRARALLRHLPPITGAAIRIERVRGLRDRRGPVHAGSFLRERRIAFDCTRAELPRIFIHEMFHFVWLRAGNPVRREFEELVAAERKAGARGELGWSAEWRKAALRDADVRGRTRFWREYCCESFCDTAAWLYAGGRHPEFTLGRHCRKRRARWFRGVLEAKGLSI
jgi:hypothetical protein